MLLQGRNEDGAGRRGEFCLGQLGLKPVLVACGRAVSKRVQPVEQTLSITMNTMMKTTSNVVDVNLLPRATEVNGGVDGNGPFDLWPRM